MQTTEKIVTILKMLGLYLYTLRNSHKSCNMLSILNEFTLQKELQTFVTNNLFWTKVKTQQQQNKKNPLPELNRGALTSKADALPLHHRVKWAKSTVFFEGWQKCTLNEVIIYFIIPNKQLSKAQGKGPLTKRKHMNHARITHIFSFLRGTCVVCVIHRRIESGPSLIVSGCASKAVWAWFWVLNS